MTDLTNITISRAAKLLQEKEISPVDLAKAFLQRIERVNPELNAYVTLAEKSVMKAAQVAESEIAMGSYRGPLHGIPIAHKDMIRTKGLRTTCGSRLLENYVPDFDAFVVECCTEAGALVLGKTNVHEFGDGPTGEASMFGAVRNPWNMEHISGGSSSGSAAAVAADLCLAATGSDTGGSIRIPSACCGVVGLKPTYGLVSKRGVFPLCWSLDHVGPICKSVEDAAIMLQVMAQYDHDDPAAIKRDVPDYESSLKQDMHGLRVGIPKNYFYTPVQNDVLKSVNEAISVLEDLGAEVQEIELPYIEHAVCAAVIIYLSEATAYHDKDIVESLEKYSPQVGSFLELGNYVPAKDYIQAQRYRRLLGQGIEQAFTQVDVLLTPTVPVTAPSLGAESIRIENEDHNVFSALLRNTEPFNLSGLPSLAIPCGFSTDGLPISLQLTGKALAERTLLQIGHAYEQAIDWRKKPPLPTN